jgi:hypothetical protein
MSSDDQIPIAAPAYECSSLTAAELKASTSSSFEKRSRKS